MELHGHPFKLSHLVALVTTKIAEPGQLITG